MMSSLICPFDGPFPRRATMDSCVGDNGPSTVAVDNGHARGGGPRFLTVKPPDDMTPEAEVVHSAEAEGRVDLLAIVDLVAILGPVRPSDGRANASVAAPIRPLAITVAVMGELAGLATLEQLRLPTVVRRSRGPWERDAGHAPAHRVPAAKAKGHPQPLGLVEPRVPHGGTKGGGQHACLTTHQGADVSGEVLVGDATAVQEETDVVGFVDGREPRQPHVVIGAQRNNVLWNHDGHGRPRVGTKGAGVCETEPE